MLNRKIITKLTLVALVTGAAYVSPALTPAGSAQAQEQEERKTRRTPALRSKVYEQLSRAQSLADEDKVEEALDVLRNVEDKKHSMNSYEKAMMYNFLGFIHYNAEDYAKAVESFEQVVAQSPIPVKFEMTTLFSLAQLEMMQGNFDASVKYLERWETLNEGEIPAKNYLLKAQAKYQQQSYEEARDYIDTAIDKVKAEEKVPEENWYVLQRAIYYELKQPEKVRDILAEMVKHYDEGKYWVQLGGMYGELGQEKEQLAILETAYQKGYIESGADMFNLAQLYYYHKAPYKGARLMELGMEEGKLERNLRNLKFLANCWTLAKEGNKAVPVLQSAAELSEDGQLDAQLGQLLLNMDRFEEAIAAADRAIEKGGLRNPGLAHLVKGMALYNTEEYNGALNELAKAEEYDRTRRMAEQWKKYVTSEKQNKEAIEASLSS
ncbi:hypothetical protein HMF8227_02311 [Saliniradius amylolyticus]|uniref:Tetratricopeptide repeat protein n=1 Tax=Saliniradius amylolyticus TaxID=2183582 RepID=A0A2S2E535_9ALTE|nr:tetratricopeptide repeat protein [Saliniradius amylolyticus]AWL12764.1 hypothetical protein HMF8227_02311 [Saliniradius amylolyticus]